MMDVKQMRIGHGFDLHRLESGRALIIGGEAFEHDLDCAGHSDGDVVYHAVTDAIFGALALPDIGQTFPDSDPQWKGAASDVFVNEAVNRMVDAGYEIGNLDVTIILERPKLATRKESMRENLAGLLGCSLEQVNVKGKTHEQVDALGEGRAIACHAVVLLVEAAADEAEDEIADVE